MQKLNYNHSESYDCFFNNSSIGIDLVVYESGYECCEPLHCWGPEEKPYNVIHYVIKGKGRLFYGEKVYDITEGQLFFMSPNVISYYEADGEDPWEYKWVAFNGIRAPSIIASTQLSDDNPILKCTEEEGNEIIKSLDDIFNSLKSEYTPNLLAVGHLYLFLSYLAKTYPKNNYTEDNMNEQRLFSILRYIQLKYTKKIKVSDISKAFNYDRTYIYKMFMKTIGMSPSEYIEGLRMKLACELIRENKLSITEIAAKTGYSDYNWFFNVFKRNFNLSPNEYAQLPELEQLRHDTDRLLKVDDMLKRYHKFIEQDVFL